MQTLDDSASTQVLIEESGAPETITGGLLSARW